jgi:hypothetical protein
MIRIEKRDDNVSKRAIKVARKGKSKVNADIKLV